MNRAELESGILGFGSLFPQALLGVWEVTSSEIYRVDRIHPRKLRLKSKSDESTVVRSFDRDQLLKDVSFACQCCGHFERIQWFCARALSDMAVDRRVSSNDLDI
jgi:hypothetical protein